jgi:hypothetical protein
LCVCVCHFLLIDTLEPRREIVECKYLCSSGKIRAKPLIWAEFPETGY